MARRVVYNSLHRLLQVFQGTVPGRHDLFPVPLVYIDGVEIVQGLVSPDGIHVGIEPLTHRELIAVQSQALPLGQGVYHLGITAGGGDLKAHGALYTAEIIVEAATGLHEQGGGDAAEI